MRKYLIEYGSNQQDVGWVGPGKIDSSVGTFISNSRDTKRHGQDLLGSAGGGWVVAYVATKAVPPVALLEGTGSENWQKLETVSQARYTPENGGRWYNLPLGQSCDPAIILWDSPSATAVRWVQPSTW